MLNLDCFITFIVQLTWSWTDIFFVFMQPLTNILKHMRHNILLRPSSLWDKVGDFNEWWSPALDLFYLDCSFQHSSLQIPPACSEPFIITIVSTWTPTLYMRGFFNDFLNYDCISLTVMFCSNNNPFLKTKSTKGNAFAYSPLYTSAGSPISILSTVCCI